MRVCGVQAGATLSQKLQRKVPSHLPQLLLCLAALLSLSVSLGLLCCGAADEADGCAAAQSASPPQTAAVAKHGPAMAVANAAVRGGAKPAG